jgi:ligand-binding sensor domain-containing protein
VSTHLNRCRLLACCLSLVFLGLGTRLPAQEPSFRVHGAALATNNGTLLSVLQGKDGFIWLGTSTGIYRFDGVEYTPVATADTLAGASVTALFQAAGGIIWAGTRTGLVGRILKGKLELFAPEEGTPKVPVTGIAEDTAGNIWFSTYGEGVYCWTGTRMYNFSDADGLGDNYSYSLAAGGQGFVWVGSDGGISLCRLEGGNKHITTLTTADGLPDNIVLKISRAADGTMWAGMHDGGICRINPATRTVDIPPVLSHWTRGPVNDLITDGKSLWAATDDHGVVVAGLDPPMEPKAFTQFEGAECRKITRVMRDREGNLWFLAGNTLVQSPGSRLEILSSKENPAFANIRSILCDRDKNLWFSNDKGLYFYPQGGPLNAVPREILSYTGHPGMNIISLYQDRDGFLWIGTFGQGALRLDPATRKVVKYTSGNGLVNDNVLSITGKGDEIWFATLGGASRCLLPPRGAAAGGKPVFEGFSEASGLGDNYIYSVFTDSKGRTWFATDGKGITVREKGHFINFSDGYGLKSKVVYSITEDRDGHIWFSTSNAGLYEYDGKVFRNYNADTVLSNSAILSLAVAGNTIFIVHTGGIDILDQSTGQFCLLGDNAGIGGINPGLNTLSTDPGDSLIWIGTDQGILKLDAAAYLTPGRPLIRLTGVRVFLTPADTLEQHSFPYNRNHLTFDFAGLWYQDPGQVHYQVMLEGYDLDWMSTRDTRVIYSSLAPGTYTFRARISLNNDFSQAETVSYRFTIRQAVWKTPWFITLVLLVAGAIALSLIRSREARLRRVEVLQKEKIQFQFETLKSQVNPHFLFNSFSTLSAIIEEDREMALDYVQKLSTFFRNILEYRDKQVITLGEELELASTYYYLQQKRYGDKFTLLTEIGPEYLGTFIPPLTLQMILENSVKYNVISADKPLTVRIFVAGDRLVISNRNQARKDVPVSTGVGLQNIRNRYKLLIDSDIHIEVTLEEYTVLLPLIKSVPT